MKNLAYKRILSGLLALCIAAPSYGFMLAGFVAGNKPLAAFPQNISTYATGGTVLSHVVNTDSTTVTWTALTRVDSTYSNKDLGAGFIPPIYRLEYDLNMSASVFSVAGAYGSLGAVSNTVGAVNINGEGCFETYLNLTGNTTYNVSLTCQGVNSGVNFTANVGTVYYLSRARTASGGTGGFGTTTLSIYSDAARTTPASGANNVQIVNNPASYSGRYISPIASYPQSGTNIYVSGTSRNMILYK